MKAYECGSLVPGCDWHTQAEETAEVVSRTVEHMRSAHGEAEVRPSTVDQIKQRIHETEPADQHH